MFEYPQLKLPALRERIDVALCLIELVLG